MTDPYTALMEELQAPAEAAPEARADATRVTRLAMRDGAIALAALSLWAASDAWYAASGLAFAALLSVLDGLAVGVVIGLIAHEWGHFAGARLGGGIAPTTGLTTLFPIFVFDMQRSPARAFRAMSVAGNAAHWSAVALLAWVLPLDAPGRMALLCGAFGFAVAASLTEFPVIGRACSGATPAESFAGLTRRVLRRNYRIGAAAGLALFVVQLVLG